MAFVSNVAFASRNVFLKLSPQSQQLSASDQQGKISICAAIFLIPNWSILYMLRTNEITGILCDFEMLKNLIIVAISHAVYNFCSISVLSKVENVVQHALLNIMKRPFTIFVSSLVDWKHSELTPSTIMGVILLVTGQCLYKLNIPCSFLQNLKIPSGNTILQKRLLALTIFGLMPFLFYRHTLVIRNFNPSDEISFFNRSFIKEKLVPETLNRYCAIIFCGY